MNAMWQMLESKWVPEACEQVIALGKQLPQVDANIGFDETGRSDNEYRRSKIAWAHPWMDDWKDVFNEVGYLFHEANKNAFGFDLWQLSEIQFTEYNGGDEGKYDWHTDINWVDRRPHHRKLSMVIQLSDSEDYMGGDLELKPPALEGPDAVRLRKRGTAICFPSLVEHRVTPVTEGKRYSLVAWYEGPKFR